tara:strand:+ start:92 stop:379 length:288 start_codon:yes stop_codon:yes gene_type:complete
MQRIYNAGPAVDKYCEETSEGSSGWDICDCCITTIESDTTPAEIGLEPYNGDPSGTGLDLEGGAWLPDNDYLYSMDYRCELCDAPLWDEDKVLPI